MSERKPGRGSDQFPLRLPDGMRDDLKDAADKNGRSMNAEIVDRLQLTFDVRWMERTTLLDAAMKAFQRSSKEMAFQADLMKWMHEQQSMSMNLLEFIASTDGNLKPEFMETLRSMLSNRGKDTGIPNRSDEV